MSNEEKTLNSNLIFDGKVVKLFKDQVLCPNNNIATREIVKHPGGVCILAVIEGKIIFEKQYRYAFNETLYELPAGKLEYNEDPYFAGIRELEEETGYKAEKLIDFGKIFPTCGYSNEIIYLYVADGLTKTKRHLDEDEFIDLLFLSEKEVIDLINTGKIKDAKTICLFSKYLMQKNRV